MKRYNYIKFIRKRMWNFTGFLICCLAVLFSCKSADEEEKVKVLPSLFPDYVNVSVPYNIAPLNFLLKDCSGQIEVRLSSSSSDYTFIGNEGKIRFPQNEWAELLKKEKGGVIKVNVKAQKDGKWIVYPSFKWEIKAEAIDDYIIYSKEVPGNVPNLNKSLTRREMASFSEKEIHKEQPFFYAKFPEKVSFRGKKRGNFGVYVMDSLFVSYISVFPDKRRENIGLHSSVLLADFSNEQYKVLPDSISSGGEISFVDLSFDSRKLFYCVSSGSVDPDSILSLKYDLMSRDINPADLSVSGIPDTVACMPAASVSYPSSSPDGNYIAYTVSGFGASSEWHDDSDMRLMNLHTGTIDSLQIVNSANKADIVRGWSSNGRWLMFSSKRDDGFYERIYFSYIDSTGMAHKPFMLPQEDASCYNNMMEIFGKLKIEN